MSNFVNGQYLKLANTEQELNGTYSLASDFIYYTEHLDIKTAKSWCIHAIVSDGVASTYVIDPEISLDGLNWKTFIGGANTVNSNYEDTFETAKNKYDQPYNYLRVKIRSQVGAITPKIIFTRK